MAKRKTAWVCTDCGAEHSKWQGQCVSCGVWNTLSEVVLASSAASPARDVRFDVQFGAAQPGDAPGDGRSGYSGAKARMQTLGAIDLAAVPRMATDLAEFDRVLGGGLVPGSVVLLGGNPGAGKSTLLLQMSCHLAEKCTALYVTGEESLQQIAMRAHRLMLPADRLNVFAETNAEVICSEAAKIKPAILVVDSIQTTFLPGLESAPGSVSQVREAAAYLTRFAKQTGTVLVLVGHVTKDGALAGPKVLEHMVDCSIMIEGESDSRFRTLRGIKNRFGAVNEVGVFAMTGEGLKEVKNPSAIFLSRGEPAPGSVVMVLWEGTRPLLVEIQALVDASPLGNPRRLAVGFEQNRLAMLLAVLHRHGGIMVGDQDVFANVVGGVRVTETSADLALLAAVVSSLRDRTLPQDLVVFGEVGLSGEIRPVPSGQERLREAAKHGFKRAIVPQANVPKGGIEGMQIMGVRKLAEALEAL